MENNKTVNKIYNTSAYYCIELYCSMVLFMEAYYCLTLKYKCHSTFIFFGVDNKYICTYIVYKWDLCRIKTLRHSILDINRIIVQIIIHVVPNSVLITIVFIIDIMDKSTIIKDNNPKIL